jgi:acyl carrier protein
MKPGVNASVYQPLVDSIRNVVAKEHGVSVTTVCLLEPRTIEKTTSGKVARAWCRRAFLANRLQLLHRWDGSTDATDVAVDAGAGGEDGAGNTKSAAESGEVDSLLGKSSEARATGNGGAGGGASGLGPALSAEELRALPVPEIMARLERTVVAVSSQGSSPLTAPIDPSKSLVLLGLDSMTVVQFKGVLERRFHCNVPDEFMFTEICTLQGLAEAAKLGHLTNEQQTLMDSHPAPGTAAPANGVNADGEERTTTMIQPRREPLCPWFTCCY